MGPRPRDLGPPQSLKVEPGTPQPPTPRFKSETPGPRSKFKGGTPGPPSKFKVGPSHLSLMKSIFSECFIFFYLFNFLSFLNKIEVKYQL